MGKETRIGISVVGVLVAISAALLYGRLTSDSGPHIEVNIGGESQAETTAPNHVPRRPTIERPAGGYPAWRPVSPAPRQHPAPKAEGPGATEFVPALSGAADPSQPAPALLPDFTAADSHPGPIRSPVASPASAGPISDPDTGSNGSGAPAPGTPAPGIPAFGTPSLGGRSPASPAPQDPAPSAAGNPLRPQAPRR